MSTPSGPSGDDEPRKRPTQGSRDHFRFTWLGLSMMGIILSSCLLGYWLDQRLQWRFPLFTLVLSLMGVAGAMMHLFRETRRK